MTVIIIFQEHTRLIDPPVQRLYTDICRVVEGNTDIGDNSLVITLMDNCQNQGEQLWMLPLKLLLKILAGGSRLTLDFAKILDR